MKKYAKRTTYRKNKKPNRKSVSKSYRSNPKLYKFKLTNTPTNRYVCLKYNENFLMTKPNGNTDSLIIRFSANDLFNVSPDNLPGTTPVGLDTWQAFYKKWYVMKSFIKVTIGGTDMGAGPRASLFCVYGGTSDQAVLPSTPMTDVAAQARTKLLRVQPFYNNPPQATKARFSPTKVFGVKDVADVVDLSGDTDTNVGPSAPYQGYYYLVLSTFDPAQTTSLVCTVAVEIFYCAVFNDTKLIQ
jgi:hypothetical protein